MLTSVRSSDALEEPSDDAAGKSVADISPECTVSALGRDLGSGDWFFDEDCEGNFAYVAMDGSDAHFPAMWDGGKWVRIESDGEIDRALPAPCYNESTLDRLGVGPRVKSKTMNCATGMNFGDKPAPRENSENSKYITYVGAGEAVFEASYPKCDGRYILIVDSIVDDPSLGDTFNRLTEAVAFIGPDGLEGKKFTVPGQCDSLRKQVDGHDIYPVYLDFGSDKSAACAAKSRYGGNVRPLIDGNFAPANNQSVDEARLALDPC